MRSTTGLLRCRPEHGRDSSAVRRRRRGHPPRPPRRHKEAKVLLQDRRGEVGHRGRCHQGRRPRVAGSRSWPAGPSSPRDLGGANDPESVAAELRQRKLQGFQVTLDIQSLKQETKPAAGRRAAAAAGRGGSGVGVRHHHPRGQAGLRGRRRGDHRGGVRRAPQGRGDRQPDQGRPGPGDQAGGGPGRGASCRSPSPSRSTRARSGAS